MIADPLEDAFQAGFAEGKEKGKAEIAKAVREYFARPCDNTLRRLTELAKEPKK